MTPSAIHLELPGLSRKASYLVAVSGGRDSVFLLHALVEAGFRRLIVCHVNHGLRGRAAAADARFVAALAAKLGLECEIGQVDVKRLAAETGQSIETAAREARYGFFAQVARRRRCRNLLLAHHADDQVETFLFNLFRGTGCAGLGGMRADAERLVKPLKEKGCGEQTSNVRPIKLRLLRPLLGLWRSEIDAAVVARRLAYREDASNRSTAHTRNRIRHELLPMLEELFGRNVRPAVWRTAEILRAEEEWLVTLAEGGTPDLGKPSAPSSLATPELRAQPAAQQRRRIHAWLRRAGVPQIGFSEVETVRSLLEGACAKVNLPGGWHARRREKRLFLEPPATVSPQRPSPRRSPGRA